MTPKTYDHPLHSLNLFPGGSPLKDEERYALPVPQGRLMVRRELRLRGGDLSSPAVDRAIVDALSYHQLDLAGFAEHEFDAGWAESVRHWQGRMIAAESDRLRLQTASRQLTSDRRQAVALGVEMWGRVTLAARLAGLRKVVISGKAPRAAGKLEIGLSDVAQRIRARDHAALLARNGFGEGRRAQLDAAIASLGALREQAIGAELQIAHLSDTLAVIRGALVGDLCRLCLVAPRVLPRQTARFLTQARLFPPRRRKEAVPAVPEG